MVKAGLNADRDVIFVDQRGTYHADPSLTGPALDEFYNRLPTMAYFDPATKTAAETATRACRGAPNVAGHDLAAFNTTENAADIADRRVALGIPAWNVYGVSYGTILALTVLGDHPEGIRSVVLDSVVPLQGNMRAGLWTWAAQGFEHLFAACDRQPACRAAYPDLRTELSGAVNALEAKPVTVDLATPAGPKSVRVDGYALANAVVLATLLPGHIQDMPKAVHLAAKGDVSPVADLVGPDQQPGTIGRGLELGVLCGEHVGAMTSEAALAAAKTALPRFPESVLTPRLPQVPTAEWSCQTLGLPPATPDPHRAVRSDVPTLVLEGALDAVTPPENAQVVLPALSHGQYLEVAGVGHDTVLWQGACVVPVISAFLRAPTTIVDPGCVTGLRDPTFTTP